MDVERGLPIVEADHQPQGDEVGLEGIEEAAAEGVAGQGPAQGVDDRVERAFGFPQLLHAQRVDHRVVGADLLPAQPALRQRAPCALGEHGDPGLDVGGRREAAAGLAIALEPAGSRAHAAHARALHEERVRGETREHVHAQPFRLLAQPAHDLAEGGHAVAVVAHGGRRGQAQRPPPREEVHALGGHGRVQGQVRVCEVREQLAEGDGIDHGAGEGVASERVRLLQDGDLDGAEPPSRLLVLLHEAGELDGAGEARRPSAHEHDVHLDRLRVGRIGADQPRQGQVRLEARRHDEVSHGR